MTGWNTFTADQWYGFTADDWYGFLIDQPNFSIWFVAAQMHAPGAVAADINTHVLASDINTHVAAQDINTHIAATDAHSPGQAAWEID